MSGFKNPRSLRKSAPVNFLSHAPLPAGVLAGDTASGPAAPQNLPIEFPAIDTADRFASISIPASDLIVNGRTLKFLIDLRSGTPVVHFVNENFLENGVVSPDVAYHWDFARRVLGMGLSVDDFNSLTYFTEPKTAYVAGTIHTYFRNGGSAPVYGIQFYPQDTINEAEILTMVTAVRAKITIPGAAFAFVPTGSQQTVVTITAQLTAAGIDLLTMDQIWGSIRYIPLNTGEAWGYLRIFPSDIDALKPEDIAVFNELPLDLSVVAGVITRAEQDNNSHVNLKSKERGTPNMVLRDAAPDNPRLAPFADKPIHLTVAGSDFTLEEVLPEVVQAQLDARNQKPWIGLQWEAETTLRSFDEMAVGSAAATLAYAKRYGSKASNLGFLCHREILGRVNQAGSESSKQGYELVSQGFGVPFSFYQRLVEYGPNAELREKLDALIQDEKAATLSNEDRTTRVSEVQALFMAAEFPPEDLVAIKAQIHAVLPGIKKIKVRSSANAEDIPNFDGAGLHDSFAATVDKEDPDPCRVEPDDDGGMAKPKVKPKTVACAVRGVYASLWNKRAIEERSFARIDHATAAMGLAIVPSYDLEEDVESNAVVITRVLNTNNVYGYTVSSQKGDNLVTNPDPGTYAETVIAALGQESEPVTFSSLRNAKPTKAGPELTEPVLAIDKMRELVDFAKKIEIGYCRAKPSYYSANPGDCGDVVFGFDKQKSLDMEVKILTSGKFIFKQVREFGGK